MDHEDDTPELPVTFHPPLYLQRRGWILEVMRREHVTSALDVGCGEGEIVACLCNPAPWLAPHSMIAPSSVSASPNCPVIQDDYIHLRSLYALDIVPELVQETAKAICPSTDHTPGFWQGYVRWEALEVKIWQGGLESYNPEFVGIDCIICTEVIEHLPEDILPEFAPMLLGLYHPRLLLVTTPSYTFNARFTAPNAPRSARKGYPDPTGRTDRIFRHNDHKFEWTVQEFAEWCQTQAAQWGYDVEVSGVGRAQEKDEWDRDEQLGYASQVAKFIRREESSWLITRQQKAESGDTWQRAKARHRQETVATHQHVPHGSAGTAGTLHQIGELVKKVLEKWNSPTASLHELWFEQELSELCGGWLQMLIMAVDHHDDLEWNIRGTKLLECDIKWSAFVIREEVREVPVTNTLAEECGATSTPCDWASETWENDWSYPSAAPDSWGPSDTWEGSGVFSWDMDASSEGWDKNEIVVNS